MRIPRSILAVSLFSIAVVATTGSAAEQAEAPSRHFLVLMSLGPAYDRSAPIDQQKAFPAHAQYMSELESKGQLVFGGPLLEDFANMNPTGAVLVLRAESAEQARGLAAADPSGLLEVQDVRAFLMSVAGK